MGRLLDFAKAVVHTPSEGETLASILAAKPHVDDAITWQEVALLNWQTEDPAKVNWALFETIGCDAADPDPAKTVLKPSKGGTIKIPRLWRPEALEDRAEVDVSFKKLTLPPPKVQGHYVIVGRGASALYNHLCLRYEGKDISSGAPQDYTWGEQERLAWTRGPTMADRDLVRTEKKDSPSVMHIGPAIEPWSVRKDERMGQHPHMLDLFSTVCPDVGAPAGDADDWLPSKSYADTLEKMVTQLKTRYDSAVDWRVGAKEGRAEQPSLSTRLVFLDGFVGSIERLADVGGSTDALGGWAPFGPLQQKWWNLAEGRRVETAEWLNSEYPFRLNAWLHARDGSWSHEHVYAYKIDICIGLLPEMPISNWCSHSADEAIKDEDLWQEAIDSITSEARKTPRRIMAGQDYIGTASKDRVCIFGGTPIGAQAAQYALEMPQRTGVAQVTADERAGVNVHDFRKSARAGSAGTVTWCNKYGFETGGWVPALRNLLEAAANEPMAATEPRWAYSKEGEAVDGAGSNILEYLEHHHGLPVSKRDPIASSLPFAIRIDNLVKFSYLAFESVERAEGKLKCVYSANPRGKPQIFLPDGPDRVPAVLTVPQGAEATTYEDELEALQQRRRELIRARYPADESAPPDPRQVEEEERLAREIARLKAQVQKGLASEYLLVDQFVYSTRTDDSKERPGTYANMLGDIALAPLKNPELSSVLVGWDGEAGSIRVIGAASRSQSWRDKPFQEFCFSMNREGHAAGGGLNLWIPMTRRANHLLTPIVPVNHATKEELRKAGLDGPSANFIVAARCVANRGIPVPKLAEQMEAKGGSFATGASLLRSRDGSGQHVAWRGLIKGDGGTKFTF